MPAGFNARHTSMVPSERPPAAGATFPYIGLAVAVLALYAILAVTMPLNPYRAAVALVAFFAMGYCTLGLVAGGRIPMSVAEILAFTVGLTILITALSALARSIVGIPFTGPDGTANSLNRSFVLGQPKSITVTVMGNDTASLYELRIRLVPLNATGTEPFHTVSTTSPLRMDAFGEFSEPIALAVGASWTQSFTIALDTAGTFTLRFELLNKAVAVVTEGHLPVVVM